MSILLPTARCSLLSQLAALFLLHEAGWPTWRVWHSWLAVPIHAGRVIPFVHLKVRSNP